jgi:hypothetical protein
METLPLRTTAQTSSKNIVPHQENLSRSQLRSRGLSTDAIAQHPASVFAACRVSDWTLRQFIFAGVSSSLRENFPLQVGCATHVQLLVKAHVACRKIILVPVTACAEGAVIRVPA